jgi:DNA-binding CsgD family transcriptional regulator
MTRRALVEDATARAAGLSGALDGLTAGIVFVDATGRIVHANHAAAEMIADGRAIAARQGRLTAPSRDAADALGEAIAAASIGDDAVGVRGVSIPIDGGNVRYVAHVLPLPAGSRRSVSTERHAAAAVFVTRAQLDAPAAAEIMAKTFGLTLAELRVLIGITQFGGIAETAEALGISEATVKTHLQRLFGKTGAARQADLVKLVAGYANPLLD